MRISCTLLGILLTWTMVFANAGNEALFAVNQNQITAKNIQHSSQGMNLELSVPDYQQSAINYKNSQNFFSASSTNQDNSSRLIIPSSNSYLRLPATGNYNINLSDSDYDLLTGQDYQEWMENFDLENLGEIDSSIDAWYPENPATLGAPAILKDFRIAPLSVSPVQINPYRQEIRVFHDLSLEFELVNDDRNSLASEPVRISQSFLPVYRNFLDWDEAELDQYALYRGSVLVIMRDNAPARNALQPWIDWKEQKGWELQYITDDDVNMEWNSQIRAEILERYENSDTPVDHIVIVGDADAFALRVPAGTLGGYEPVGDHHYTTLAGNDELPDVTIGRISVTSVTQIAIYVNKLLTYEKEPYMVQTDWYRRGLVAAGSSVSGYTTILLGRYARNLMFDNGFTQVDTAWYNDGLGDQNSRIIEGINDGVSFYMYRGLLGTGLSNGEIESLNNNNMTPVVLDITCGTGNWVNGTGLNESYILTGTASTARGGVCAFGTATSHTNTRFNNALCSGVLEAAFVLKVPEVGIMGMNGKLNMCKNYVGYQDNNVSDFSLWFNLMGDPTVWMWSDVPQELDVIHPEEFFLSDGVIEVNVSDDGVPLENAWVTIYRDAVGGNEIFRGITDASGNVSLPVEFTNEGDAILTVTKQNYAPYQVTIDVSSPGTGIAAVIDEINDTNGSGRSGNGNGIAEAGETVEININVLNVGSSNLNNVFLSGSSDDEFVESITGNYNLGTLYATSETPENATLLVEISESTPDLWMLPIDLNFTTNSGDLTTSLMLEISSSNFDLGNPGNDIYIDNSGSDNIEFLVRNIGSAASGSGTAHLESLSEALNVVTANVNFVATPSGQYQELDPIIVSVAAGSMSGLLIPANLIFESDNGRLDTVSVDIKLGSDSDNNPTGPDNYGYYAHENNDITELAPDFSWIEINPESESGLRFGNKLDLNDDRGLNQDQAVVVDLPFPVTYYGVTYNQMTVCSNGWVAMGVQNNIPAPRNWRIPSPIGPGAMIAPYWDDRILVSDAAVYDYYDELTNTYTIEWYRVRDALSDNPCTFQVVFYENEHFPTENGDTEFIFNYLQVDNSIGLADDNAYWTTGIENLNQTDGLELYYWNDRAETLSFITAGRSILFSTRTEIETATVSGLVRSASNNSPIGDAVIISEFPGRNTSTDFVGSFNFELPVGTNNLVISAPGYNDYVLENLDVTTAGVSGLQIELTQPVFSVSHDEIEITLNRGMTNTLQVTVSNNGDGLLEFVADLLREEEYSDLVPDGTHPNELDDPGSFLGEIVLDSGNNEYEHTGVAFDGEYYWLIGDSHNPNMIYRYSADGEYEDSFTQGSFYSSHDDIATDGVYLYAIDGFSFYSYFIENNGDLTYEGYVNIDLITYDEPIALTFDPNRGYLWTACDEGFLIAYSTNGRDRITHTYPFSFEEIAWNGNDPDGYYIYAVTVDYSNTRRLVRIEPSSGAHEEIVTLNDVSDTRIAGMDITRSYDPWIVSAVMLIDESGTANDRLEFRQLSVDLDWVNINNNTRTVSPGEDLVNYLQFDTGTLPSGSYNSWLRFSHNATGRFQYIPVTLNVSGADIEDDGNAEIPLEWEFNGAYPNPFNPSTSIAFTLKNNANVKATIYNVLGQNVATLANREMQAGHHTMQFDGNNLSSGIYFLKFEAGPLNTTSKLMLIK